MMNADFFNPNLLAQGTAFQVPDMWASAELVSQGILFEWLNAYPLPTVAIAPPGHSISIQWASVPGADRAEIDTAELQIGPARQSEAIGELPMTASQNHYVITIPSGIRLTRLKLEGLAVKENDGKWTPITTTNQLQTDNPRLVVSMPNPAGGWLPLYSVPSIPQRGIVPAQFRGASFKDAVLTLPGALKLTKLQLALMKNSRPEEFEAREMKLDRILAWGDRLPQNLEVVGPDGMVLWSFPGEMPPEAAIAPVDVRVPLMSAINTALANQQPLNFNITVRGSAPGLAQLNFTGVQGALVRSFPGVSKTVLAGESQRLDLEKPLKSIPLTSEVPTAAIADVTIRYDSLRILEDFSDPLPPTSDQQSGVVVGDQPIVRSLPPAAFQLNHPIGRVGLWGRAPVDCELSVQWVSTSAGIPGAPLATPSVISMGASTQFQLWWTDVPDVKPLGPVGLSVRANRGRFLWVMGKNGPLLRLVVQDPDPGGRSLFLNQQSFLPIQQSETHLPQMALPAAIFQGQPPILHSSLFLTVDLSDLSLRYRR